MLSIDREHTAVLAMDFQADIVAMLGEAGGSVVAKAGEIVAAARAAGLPVIYVVVGFRPGYPEVSPRNVAFSGIRQSGRLTPGSPGSEIHQSLAPRGNEVVVTKHRVGAFSGTDLEMVLRAASVDTLVLTGIATSGVVLSTLRHAADGDYRLVVAADACADRDAEVHRVLLEKVFPRQATIATADEVVKAIRG